MNWIAVAASLVVLGAAPSNEVYERLTTTGVCRLGGAECVRLPTPDLPDGLDAAAQAEVLARIAGPNRRVEELLRDSIVAPFVFSMDQRETAPGRRPLRSVDLWFVAHGRLDRLDSEEALQRFGRRLENEAGDAPPSECGFLSAEQLGERGIRAEDAENRRERYVFGGLALFDRVFVRATQHVVVTRAEQSVLVAGAIDPRFTADRQFPNAWQPLVKTADDSGRFRFEKGPARPYESAGFYAKATRLRQPEGALLIEYHLVFDEPEEWFGGANLLRSKLPMAVQDAVRKFRRSLRELDSAP